MLQHDLLMPDQRTGLAVLSQAMHSTQHSLCVLERESTTRTDAVVCPAAMIMTPVLLRVWAPSWQRVFMESIVQADV